MYYIDTPYLILLLVLNIVISAMIARYFGSKRNIGFGWSFFLCLLFSPLIGFVITMISGPKEKG